MLPNLKDSQDYAELDLRLRRDSGDAVRAVSENNRSFLTCSPARQESSRSLKLASEEGSQFYVQEHRFIVLHITIGL